MTHCLPWSTVSEVHQNYFAGTLIPSEVLKVHFDVARADTSNAFLHLAEKRAQDKARECDQQLAQVSDEKAKEELLQKYPLFGIPIPVKDNLLTRGVPTTCASRMLEGYVPSEDATCIARLENAGAIVYAKLNMDEFAMGGSNENSAFGPVSHPTHPDRVPGGSSGASAAVVAAGQALVSLGSDTGGSVRLPASFCGVFGMKPTYGRVSRYGLVAFGSSLDQVGPLARDPRDAARVLDVISGHDPLDSTSLVDSATQTRLSHSKVLDWKKLRLGVPREYLTADLTPEVKKVFENFRKELAQRGAQVCEVSLPHTRFAVPTYYVVAVSEASSNLSRFDGARYGVRADETSVSSSLGDFYEKARGLFGSEVKRRILLGTFSLSSGYCDEFYGRACRVRRKIKEDFDQVFQDVDALISPVAPSQAFRKGDKNDPLQMYAMDSMTIPASLAGLPAASIPWGASEDLPTGMQLVLPARKENLLFQMSVHLSDLSGGRLP